jgi:hypothetical protein
MNEPFNFSEICILSIISNSIYFGSNNSGLVRYEYSIFNLWNSFWSMLTVLKCPMSDNLQMSMEFVLVLLLALIV